MSALRQLAADYLTMRRAAGYKLSQEGRMLIGFVSYLEQCGTGRVTIEAALAWATEPRAAPGWHAARLSVVRGFARYLAAVDGRTEVPPSGLIPSRERRAVPYLYSPGQITAVMGAARRLPSPLRAATFEALIGLMAVTGLRTGEAMNLDLGDVDLAAGMLVVRCSKFGKDRQVPLHPTTASALNRYTRRRDELCPQPSVPAFFLSGAGTRLNHTNTSKTFTRLLRAAGIPVPPGRHRPRLYDLRHSFAVATLVTWYAQGADVPARLPALSTYLGHVSPATTYWYLRASPELMTAAARQLERFWELPS